MIHSCRNRFSRFAFSILWANDLTSCSARNWLGLRLRRAQCGDVQHRGERAAGIEHRRCRAGQRNMGRIEMIGLMYRQGFLGRDAGADRAGAGMRLVPVGAEIEAGLQRSVLLKVGSPMKSTVMPFASVSSST